MFAKCAVFLSVINDIESKMIEKQGGGLEKFTKPCYNIKWFVVD